MKEKVFNVDGMSCNHCVMAVKEAVEDMEGVSGCDVNLEQGTAKVTFSEDVIESDIVEAIEEEGFKVS
ncbi:copper ion binding protein [Denitrovibrio acetiphilus DSM 12809]|uniref:Copper ion binding protein n=1 Tax=Denitrovibrio acetiphilus (strain DSM 12809 / NBRC 114555 / N2460) TaxID=522772 RepID=D4H3M8_DENA2|nr:copper ion binding protein [Denitrovibrio acetiphilus]ADD69130.1 copper ion binding protein [Denitrovibrio acetiphilus DSM 12809]